MRPYLVSDVILDDELNPVVILSPWRPAGGLRELVLIWVGVQDAALISIALEGQRSPRPLAHDVIETILATFDAAVDRVELWRNDDGLFDGVLTIVSGAGRVALDCRPEDALAMAVRGGVAIQIDDAVIQQGGVAQGSRTDVGAEEIEARIAAFRRFIDRTDPRDFRS